jgi:SAM-dependent methyltransferase
MIPRMTATSSPRADRHPDGVSRSLRLFRLFLAEQSDPVRCYEGMAEDAARQAGDYLSLDGTTVLDVGGGPGHFTAAFRARGAACVLVEPDLTELRSRGAAPAGAVIGDGLALPVRDGAAGLCFSANVLEHVPDPVQLINEMIRVTKPGGLVYLSYTNWYSPWGGHEMSPWHYLGHGYAERRYRRRHGKLPKNRCGSSLFPVHIGTVLRLLKSRPDIELVDARPRYYPGWCRPLVKIPWLREVATWNLLLILRPTAHPAPDRPPLHLAKT